MELRRKFERKWGKTLTGAVKVLQQDGEQTTTPIRAANTRRYAP